MNAKELTLQALLVLRSNVKFLIKGEELSFEQFGKPQVKRYISCSSGICHSLYAIILYMSKNEINGVQVYPNNMYELFNSWEKFSGNIFYPVPSPDNTLNEEDIYIKTKNVWFGEYGQLRIELLDFMIETLQSELSK